MIAASAAMPPLSQSGNLVPFGEGYLEAASFVDDPPQAIRYDATAVNNQPASPIFGMETEPAAGEVAAKWRAVETDIDREQQILSCCRAGEACPSIAKELLDIVAEGAGRSGRARGLRWSEPGRNAADTDFLGRTPASASHAVGIGDYQPKPEAALPLYSHCRVSSSVHPGTVNRGVGAVTRWTGRN
jgi:hypothetical protein